MPTPEEKILNQLQGAPQINPASARLFTDWTLEPGDVVTVRSTEGDSVRNYQLPIYSMDFNWNGSPMMEISSSGNPEREPLPELVRKEYAEATSSRGMGRRIAETEEEIRQYRTWQTKTDKKIGDYAEIMGVTIDPETGDVVYETDEQGNIRLDEDGNPIPVFDPTSPYSLYAKHEVTAQRIVNYVGLTGIRFDAHGNPIYKQAKDAQGNPIYDAQGNPVYETDSQGNPIPDLDADDGHSMYSQISQTIDSIDSVVSGHSDDISRIEQKADSIISEVTAARNGEATLSSRISQLAGEISSVVTKTGVNNLGQSETLYSKITQTESSLTSRIGDVEDDVETNYSLITQTSDKVGMVVVTQTAQDGTTSNKINVAGIVTAINNDNTTETVIQANKIVLNSDQTQISISDIFSASSTVKAPAVHTAALYADSITTAAYGSGTSPDTEGSTVTMGTHLLSMSKGTGQNAVNVQFLGNGDANLNHSHVLTISEITTGSDAGKIQVTLGNPTVVASESTGNFKIADTQAYRDGVSAARSSVEVGLITWTGPTASDNQSETHGKHYSLSAMIPLVYQTGVDGQGEPVYTTIRTYGPISQNITGVYNDGWNAGNLAVTLYDSGWANGQRTIGTSGRISASGQPAEIRETIDLAGGVIGAYDSTENTLSFNIYDGTGDNSVDTGEDVIATVVPGTVTVTPGTYNADTHLLPITASASPKVGGADIPVSGTGSVSIVPGTATPGTPSYTRNGIYTLSASGTVNINGTDYALTGGTGTFFAEGAVNNGFGTCKNSITLNYTSDQTVQPGSPITIFPVVRTSYSDDTPTNLTAKGITISAAASTYLDQWLYGTGGNDAEANTGAFYRVYANDYQHPVKGTQVQLTHSQAGTTRLVDFDNTTKVLAKIDNPKVSGIVTSGYQKIILAASDTGANVSKEVRVTYTDGLGENRNIIIDASAVYQAGQGSGTITGPTWNDYTGDLPANRTATYSRGTETAATLRLFLTTESTWTNHTKTVYMNPGTASATEVAKIVIDASNEYSAGQRSVVIDTATLSNVVYNSSARSARATLTVSLDNGATKSFSNVDVSTPYQAGLDGESAVDSQRFTIRLTDNSEFSMDKTKAVDTSAIYLQGVHDAEPVFEPVARYVWAESNNGAIIFYKNSTGSVRWGTLEANTRVWLMQENAVNGRYYVKFESYNSGSGSFSEYLGYIPTQFVHEAMKSGLYPGGGWIEAPDEETTMYIYDAGGNYVTVYSSNSINSSVVGQLYPNTEVTCLSVSNDWAQIRVVSNGSSVKCYVQYSIHLQSTETSQSKYGSARGWVSTPQAITITGYQIQEIRHSSGIYSSPLNVKMSNIRDNSMREYTSTATQSTTYENIATSGDPGDFLNLVNTSSGLKYYAWHNSTTYSGDVGHKVKMAVSYSDGNTETVWISILSKATNNYNYIN